MNTVNSSAPKRRLFTRIPFETGVVLNTFPGKHECRLVDISLKGALVERLLPWSAKIVTHAASLSNWPEAGHRSHVSEVAHAEDGRLGIRCTEIDLESITNCVAW